MKHQSTTADRILDQPIRLIGNILIGLISIDDSICLDEEIDHPFINKALEDMVNQNRFLPSFHDVLDIVERTNEKCELGLR